MIQIIQSWFSRAFPNPTDRQRAIQYGVHLEEINEMLAAVGDVASKDLAADFYKKYVDSLPVNSREDLLDSLCDQIVTAIGVGYTHGFDMAKALEEVNRSNWSKFNENGEPIFDENGKIKKGPRYTPPNLSKFI